jgi:hypothetical protein
VYNYYFNFRDKKIEAPGCGGTCLQSQYLGDRDRRIMSSRPAWATLKKERKKERKLRFTSERANYFFWSQ